MIPTGVILIWPGTNGTIPVGWTRETNLDDKYPKAWGVENANVTGGSNTHSHTGTVHSHTMVDHSHNVTVGYDTEHVGSSDPGGSGTSGHKHNNPAIGNTSGGTTSSDAIGWSSVNSEPPYYKVIFIRPSKPLSSIKPGICGHFQGDSTPSGWVYCDGNNSTPDLRGKYLKGASQDGDSGVGIGTSSHIHTVTHNHSGSGHTHSGNSGTWTDGHGDRQSINWDEEHQEAQTNHTHTYYLDNRNPAVLNYTNTSAGGNTIDLAYKKLGVIKCVVPIIKKGFVGLWLGNVNAIPVGWFICDGTKDTLDLRDKFLKIGNDLSENDATGGANTHTHSYVSHVHPGTSHSHVLSMSGSSSNGPRNGGGGNGWSYITHTHPQDTVTSTTPSYASANLDSGSAIDHQPTYRTVAYIMFKYAIGGLLAVGTVN